MSRHASATARPLGSMKGPIRPLCTPVQRLLRIIRSGGKNDKGSFSIILLLLRNLVAII